jgi:hypothetical protein
MRRRFRLSPTLAALSMLAGVIAAVAQEAPVKEEIPVKEIADQRFEVVTPQGRGLIPVMASRPLDRTAPEVKRVIITLHGLRRNAPRYFAAAEQAVAAAGEAGRFSVVVAPQFLTGPDIEAFGLPPATLRWRRNTWREGLEASSPLPISSYAVLDALLAHFADRGLYPQLAEVLLVGHSAGGQLPQRYAVVGRGEDALREAHIALRYVVANPSSYLCFNAERPLPEGGFAPADTAACPGVDHWHYGFEAVPAYLAGRRADEFERPYIARDVTYLLGMADTDPNHRLLDRSCAGLAQGPFRLARGLSYFAYLRARHGSELRQRLVEVPGVAHNDRKMYTSPCGLAVLFDLALPEGCPHQP